MGRGTKVIPLRYVSNYKGIMFRLKHKTMLDIMVVCMFDCGTVIVTDVRATEDFKQSSNLDKLATIIRLQNMLENKHDFKLYTSDVIFNLFIT